MHVDDVAADGAQSTAAADSVTPPGPVGAHPRLHPRSCTCSGESSEGRSPATAPKSSHDTIPDGPCMDVRGACKQVRRQAARAPSSCWWRRARQAKGSAQCAHQDGGALNAQHRPDGAIQQQLPRPLEGRHKAQLVVDDGHLWVNHMGVCKRMVNCSMRTDCRLGTQCWTAAARPAACTGCEAWA